METTNQLPNFLMGGIGLLLLLIATAWSLVWKGIALWKAARNGCKVWYLIILLINTLGILEILYIFVFSKSKSEEATPSCCSCNR
jgi:hypothetical protein